MATVRYGLAVWAKASCAMARSGLAGRSMVWYGKDQEGSALLDFVVAVRRGHVWQVLMRSGGVGLGAASSGTAWKGKVWLLLSQFQKFLTLSLIGIEGCLLKLGE